MRRRAGGTQEGVTPCQDVVGVVSYLHIEEKVDLVEFIKRVIMSSTHSVMMCLG